MDLTSILRTIRTTWPLILGLTLLGGGAGALVAAVTTPTYTATTRMFFAFEATAGAPAAELVQANNFAIQRVFSYTEVVETPRVLDRVIDELGMDTDAEELARDISVSVPTNSVILDISASAANPQDAATLTGAISSTFIDVVVNELESPSTGGAGPVRAEILQEATAPELPASPSYPLYIALGLFSGLVLGLLTATILALADRRVHNRAEVERLSGLPVLAGISGAPGKGLVLNSRGLGVAADGYRGLAAAIVLDPEVVAGKTLTLLSPSTRENSAAVAANLAMALAKAGVRTVVVDGDLQRKGLSKLLGVEERPGLAERLAGDPGVAPISTGTPGLSVLPAGQGGAASAEPFAAGRFGALAQELASDCDIVLVDSPPVLSSPTAGFLAAASGATTLVVQTGRTTGPEVRSALDTLTRAGANVIGLTLTDVPTSGPDADAHSRALVTAGGKG
ncbi:polysaccharide biosynthesis tyrosine autokinase [Naasia sp. SYSU D00948]|uniref:polysaccharide biosynthesis tyrosine autokinase n=1 Tax=Naasia sp. SYSU D00948 TaxID=2817379 RepID=UPI001B31699E|nr:polysaccharide biosynthesis tyrosine autokinase [Naasia sp. SYSU D00948]